MHEPMSADGVDSNVLDCLNSWPEGTLGWMQERTVTNILNILCGLYGYGRVPQLAAEIEAIWRDPSKIEEFTRRRNERLKEMEDLRKAAILGRQSS